MTYLSQLSDKGTHFSFGNFLDGHRDRDLFLALKGVVFQTCFQEGYVQVVFGNDFGNFIQSLGFVISIQVKV